MGSVGIAVEGSLSGNAAGAGQRPGSVKEDGQRPEGGMDGDCDRLKCMLDEPGQSFKFWEHWGQC